MPIILDTLNVTKDTQRLTSATIWGILRGLESFSQLIYLTDDHSCVCFFSLRKY